MDVLVRWESNSLQGVGVGSSGHGVLIDSADPAAGGRAQAASPVELLLMSLCGCTGMDVVAILGKMRVGLERLEVGALGVREAEHPRRFTRITLVYRAWGAVEEAKLTKAIELSLTRYCPVANTLKGSIELDYRFEINPTDDDGGTA